MEISDFWNWVKNHNDDCLVQYNKDSKKLTLAFDGRTLSDFTNTFVPDFESKVSAIIVSTAIVVDVVELLDDEFTSKEIWDERIENLNTEW